MVSVQHAPGMLWLLMCIGSSQLRAIGTLLGGLGSLAQPLLSMSTSASMLGWRFLLLGLAVGIRRLASFAVTEPRKEERWWETHACSTALNRFHHHGRGGGLRRFVGFQSATFYIGLPR